jgi:hypothetical protein
MSKGRVTLLSERVVREQWTSPEAVDIDDHHLARTSSFCACRQWCGLTCEFCFLFLAAELSSCGFSFGRELDPYSLGTLQYIFSTVSFICILCVSLLSWSFRAEESNGGIWKCCGKVLSSSLSDLPSVSSLAFSGHCYRVSWCPLSFGGFAMFMLCL